ncbi:MAG: LamG domain-containing protein [Actinomycetota bacterium]|nr:LamG domain-containing protein [Actinomycetota bacterium]
MSRISSSQRALSQMRRAKALVLTMSLAATLMVGAPFEASAAEITTTNWPANGNANDVGGNQHGTLVNGTAFTSGKVGQAFSFDGIDDHVSFGSVAGNVGTADFTLAFWVKTTSSGRKEGIIGKRPECMHGSMFDVRLNPTGTIHVELDGSTTGTDYKSLGSTALVNDGAFHHVAVVRKGTTAWLYVDGRVQMTKSTPGVTNINNNVALVAGKSVCTGADGTLHFTGVLDEVVLGPDRDTDGRPNTVDNCPIMANATQEDADGDGAGDACEDPAAPFLSNLAPGDGAAVTTSTPTLSATFEDPNPLDDGRVEFEVYQDANLVASNAAGSSPVVRHGETATWQMPTGTLQGGRTYTWRARAFDGVNYSQWTSTPASRTLLIGGTYPTIGRWSADHETGRVDYSLRVNAAALNAPGDVAGPCYQIACSWRVESRYSNGTIQSNFGAFGSGTLASNTSSMNEAVSGVAWMEATEIRTIVEPGSCDGYQCNQARTRYDSGWIKVRDPYPTGSISLAVNRWQRDPETGVITYDLKVGAGGAAQVGGPCHEKACQWRVEVFDENGSRGQLSSEQLPGGTWSFSRTVAGTTSGRFTHLKATLDSICGVNLEYWCWDPWETYTTALIPVSDYVYKGQDLATAAVALAPVLTRNRSFFCTRFLLRAGTHHLRSTLTDQYIACEAAVAAAEYTIVRVLESIVDAPGPARFTDFLPESFPRPDSEVPPVRQDWETETECVQNIPAWSVEAIAWKIEERHGYESTARASRWSEDAPWKDLVWPYAMRYKAIQGSRADRCERVIDYRWVVGYEYVSGEERLTTIYTVVTDKYTGNLVTAHPGRPGEDQDW